MHKSDNNKIPVGSKWYFEYHCYEGHDSADAKLWYHSHQVVEILSCENDDEFGDLTFEERIDNGTPLVYKVKFSDGFKSEVFEDELCASPEDYCRPDPPKMIGI
jgi:hypothetical protein